MEEDLGMDLQKPVRTVGRRRLPDCFKEVVSLDVETDLREAALDYYHLIKDRLPDNPLDYIMRELGGEQDVADVKDNHKYMAVSIEHSIDITVFS